LPSIKNELGNVSIDNEVIAKIAGTVAMDCYGIVGMAAKDLKDGFVQLLKKENLTKGVKLYSNDSELNIDLHIIVELGTNINVIADTLSNTVRYKLEEILGFKINKVNIFVEGARVDF
jgi:uncharacterized alkaline shock family protein YloU